MAFFRAVPEWRGFFEPTDARRDVMICTYQYEWKNGKHVKKENAMDVTKEQWYPGKWRREVDAHWLQRAQQHRCQLLRTSLCRRSVDGSRSL